MQDKQLSFSIQDGLVANAFFRQGAIAAHALLSSGTKPRFITAFPAENGGVGVWFEDLTKPVTWTMTKKPSPIETVDRKGRPLRGITVDTTADSAITVKRAVLSNIRVLRSYKGSWNNDPDKVAVAPEIVGKSVVWARDRLDGKAGYLLSIEVIAGDVATDARGQITLRPPAGAPLQLRLTSLTGETPLTPLEADHLLNANAGSDERARNVLEFLSYKEKYLAGSWQYCTYFGRDTLMSIRLLMPALTGEAVESGLGSVLFRLSPDGEVAHEEDIGEFAVLEHQEKDGTLSDTPYYDYKMIDDDFMLGAVASEYLLRHPDGQTRAAAFLASASAQGPTQGALLVRNLVRVVRQARSFAADPKPTNLVGITHPTVGNWRDSNDGLGGGHYPYDVNAVLVPAALQGIADLQASGLLAPYLDASNTPSLGEAKDLATVWRQAAPPLFITRMDEATARAAVQSYAISAGVPAAAALASLPTGPLVFNALSLDTSGQPIPIVHSDNGFNLLFGNPPAEEIESAVTAMMRPFPAGLMTDIGLLVANPAYASTALQAKFGPGAYHGTLVWSWQQALLASGMDKQIARTDLPEATRTLLVTAHKKLWAAINAAGDVRSAELWSWTYANGQYKVVPYAEMNSITDEANAAQLWSTVFLALHAPS